MVGIVLVSHSRPLAMAVQELVRSMTGPALPLAIAAGAGENHQELGTDAVEISEAILSVHGPDGVLVLMDMGSAILSSETALDLMEEKDRANVRFCPAPFVEGAVAAGVTANLGLPLAEVHAEALASLAQKENALPQGKTAPLSSATSNSVSKEEPAQAIRLVIRNAHGLHARPAAHLISAMKSFEAEINVKNLSNQRGPAPLRSLSRLASLEILQGHEIEISASGPDAAVALKKIEDLAQGGFGEELPAGKTSGVSKAAIPPKEISPPVPISAGLALGPAFPFQEAALEIPQNEIENVSLEIERLKTAIAGAQKVVETRRNEMVSAVGLENAKIYEAQSLSFQDPELIDRALQTISDQHKNAALAWSQAIRVIADRYATLEDNYLRARGADIEDVGRLVLEKLGVKSSVKISPGEGSILIAEDLTPQQVSELPRGIILGVVLLGGGPTAHSSIMLRALGIPAVVQARSAFARRHLSREDLVALDGGTGEIWLNPEPALVAQLKARQKEQHQRALAEKEAKVQPAVMLDGDRVQIFANLGRVNEAAGAADSGAEGVGLLRTEFLFLDRETAPTEEEQMQALHEIAAKFEGRPIIVRTLDVGGDKEVSYLRLPQENNPFLGVRALRLCFERPDLFRTQLRAILRAGSGHLFKIMFPMVADLSDLKRARGFLEQIHAELVQEGLSHLWPLEIGIMVETPSAALQSEALAAEADFFSIGTNDLTQYTLAADRGNPALGNYQDALHPAVLQLIDLVVRGAAKKGRLVAVCGEAAADQRAALIFIGLGVEELSVSATKIPRLKATLRKQKREALRQLAARALKCHSALEVRQLAQSFLPSDS
jgi:phosphoenolpyruvate-protein phosphotransferase/dihydroxyacetone kinase phosphotransfer subunit